VSATPAAGAQEAASGQSPRRWRWRRWLVGLLLLAVSGSVGVGWLLQPERLVPMLLKRAGDSLGLEISAGPDPQLRLRDRPVLELRAVRVRDAARKTEIFTAERALIAIPWSTVRDAEAALRIERLELDAPVLHLPALLAWLDARPPSEDTRIPELDDGLTVRDGRLLAEGWRIDDVQLRLPSVHPGKPLRAQLRGRYRDDATALPFDLALALSAPDNGAGLGIGGTLTVIRDGWRMPAAVHLSGPLWFEETGLRIAPAAFGLSARYETPPEAKADTAAGGEPGSTADDTSTASAAEASAPLRFALGLHGPLHVADDALRMDGAGLVLHGAGGDADPVPTLRGRAGFWLRTGDTQDTADALRLSIDGALAAWPQAWPALPPPVGESRTPLPLMLRYAGALDLSDDLHLLLRRDTTRFEAKFGLYDVLAWTERSDGSPLPPLDGRLTTPRLEISGATLEGVEVELTR
jgi:hypothetical protein